MSGMKKILEWYDTYQDALDIEYDMYVSTLELGSGEDRIRLTGEHFNEWLENEYVKNNK